MSLFGRNFWERISNALGVVKLSVPIDIAGGGRGRVHTPLDEMILQRTEFTDRSTIGQLYFDGDFKCYMLEPTCRAQPNIKVAIPQGKYEIVMYDSPKMKKKVIEWKANGKIIHPLIEAARVPLLLKVPGHEFVEIHIGNRPEDTEDCFLPGNSMDVNWVGNSTEAWISLVTKIEEKLRLGAFYFGVVGGGQ